MRPASYKSSLSLALPVGTTRQKDKRELISEQSDRKLHIVENTAVTQRRSGANPDTAERMRRENEQAKLKELYGDASAQAEASRH